MPGKHQSFHDFEAQLLAERLEKILDELIDLEEYAEGEDYRAVFHKLQESSGPLTSALTAARQYEIGELTR